jgi:hypothetical protein
MPPCQPGCASAPVLATAKPAAPMTLNTIFLVTFMSVSYAVRLNFEVGPLALNHRFCPRLYLTARM